MNNEQIGERLSHYSFRGVLRTLHASLYGGVLDGQGFVVLTVTVPSIHNSPMPVTLEIRENVIGDESLDETAHRCVRAFMQHEADEGFCIDGEAYRDPHDPQWATAEQVEVDNEFLRRQTDKAFTLAERIMLRGHDK